MSPCSSAPPSTSPTNASANCPPSSSTTAYPKAEEPPATSDRIALKMKASPNGTTTAIITAERSRRR